MGFFAKFAAKLGRKDKDLAQKIDQAAEASRKAEISTDTKGSYDVGLNASSKALSGVLAEMTASYRQVDEAFFDHLYELLVGYDVGSTMAQRIVREVKNDVKLHGVSDPKLVHELVIDRMFTLYVGHDTVTTTLDLLPNRTNVFLVVGANGVGKTTSIAKLAQRYLIAGEKVLIVAGDTFRAGAVAQLEE
ncbi:unnamed protein product [Didymodactylos carnosus]|uniref:Signal recognition particle SRP54 helical bundle domain-containing protein n=1 Tax=Didymodactylos carnosus TaxID=1234261 RepID=A0A8S2D539_9BILA|nr:unnamed protein product [Didymodactylos carnosus]CAF3588570.1 unnamed protein product [Didymodactylos carnosus]